MHIKETFTWVNFLGVITIALILLSGCSPNRFNFATPYLDSTKTITLSKYPFPHQEQTIQPYEFVEVRFAGQNANVSNTLNKYGGESLETRVTDNNTTFTGQQVDKEGNLNFPLIGKVSAAGLTVDSLRSILLLRVDSILRDPYVYVNLPKRGVTILGEVSRPAAYVFSKERANLLDFFAQAGSVTQFADLSKVKIYRESPDGTRVLGHVNLNDSTLFQSPFFYPIPNDVVYIPSSQRKALQSSTSSILPFVSIFISLITVTLTLLR